MGWKPTQKKMTNEHQRSTSAFCHISARCPRPAPAPIPGRSRHPSGRSGTYPRRARPAPGRSQHLFSRPGTYPRPALVPFPAAPDYNQHI